MMKNKSVWLGILLIVIVVLMTTGCIFYNLLKPEDFKNQFSAVGYTISDKETSEYESNVYLVATKEDVPFKIEYYEFDSEINAKKVYEKHKKNIAKYITTNSKNNEKSGAVFTKIVAVSDEEYIVISRVKNTLIFIAGTKDFQSEIDSLLENIRY